MKQKSVSIIILLLLFCQNVQVSGQEKDYQEIFGQDWINAEKFLSENNSWIKPLLDKYDVSYAEAVAVIFPELVRYSSVMDRIEITLLKTLYVNLGKEYANFSIGSFQMKPSFAEAIGQVAGRKLGHRYSSLVRDSVDFNNIHIYRKAIVSDLEDTRKQLDYLIVFLKICSRNFNLKSMTPEERIRFLATAYNYGFNKKQSEIVLMEDRKYFGTGIIKKTLYQYSDVSLFWYNRHSSD